MIEGLLIFLGGLMGAGHCLGMCGGFVLTLGSSAPSLAANLHRQGIYACGRVCVYILAGAIVGYTGWRLGTQFRSVVNLQAGLSVAAGVLLIVQGLIAAGVFRWWRTKHGSCPGAGRFAGLLRTPNWQTVFVAGLCNGALPCGLVYAYLALAAAAGDILRGALIMTLFGLGTMPALMVAGAGGSLVSLTSRKRILHVAAWCMVATGLLAAARGFGFLDLSEQSSAARCPLCISRMLK